MGLASNDISDLVSPGLVDRFMVAIGRAAPGSKTGDAAPYGLHWCLAVRTDETSALAADGLAPDDDAIVPDRFSRRMWAGSRLSFLGELKVGDAVTCRSSLVSAREKEGKTGPLLFVTKMREFMVDGKLCLSEETVIVHREANAKTPEGMAAIADAKEEWSFSRSLAMSEAMLFRYSAVTFNAHRIHYDRDYATRVEYYPELIVHGPLTATLLLDSCAEALRGRRIASIRFRARSPGYCGQTMRFVGREAAGQVAMAALDPAGRIVMTAEVEVKG